MARKSINCIFLRNPDSGFVELTVLWLRASTHLLVALCYTWRLYQEDVMFYQLFER